MVTVLLLPFQFGYFFFSCLIAMARTSNTMLSRSSESGFSCLVPKFSGKAFKFSLLSIMLALSLLCSKYNMGTSLVVQWLRICLPMQGTWVQSLVREDPTCRGATRSVCHNCWACEPQLLSPRATAAEAHVPRARAPQQERSLQWEARAPQWRAAPALCN